MTYPELSEYADAAIARAGNACARGEILLSEYKEFTALADSLANESAAEYYAADAEN